MRRALVLLLFAAGCGPAVELTPASGSSFGQFEVSAKGSELSQLADPVKVSVGGVAAYGVSRPSSIELRFNVQGAAVPGPAEVVAWDKARSLRIGEIVYAKPRDP